MVSFPSLFTGHRKEKKKKKDLSRNFYDWVKFVLEQQASMCKQSNAIHAFSFAVMIKTKLASSSTVFILYILAVNTKKYTCSHSCMYLLYCRIFQFSHYWHFKTNVSLLESERFLVYFSIFSSSSGNFRYQGCTFWLMIVKTISRYLPISFLHSSMLSFRWVGADSQSPVENHHCHSHNGSTMWRYQLWEVLLTLSVLWYADFHQKIKLTKLYWDN